MSQALSSHARLLLLPYARSAHRGHVLGLRSLSSHGAAAVPYGEHQRQRDEEGKEVKVTVWWDFQKCLLPPGSNPFRVGSRVTAALRGVGIRGPVEINAFGDVSMLTRDEQEALAATGITFSHVPKLSSEKQSCDRSFMADLISWIAQNPPPAHFFLISGDKEFANILHRLRMSNYNILLACPGSGSKELRSAATIMWTWGTLLKGVNVTPSHVNQPPDADGVSYSWYGHYKGAVDIQLLKSKDNMALPRNTKVPQIPKHIVKAIKKVLQFYPEGLNLQNLRAELRRINVSMDRGFYGFTKFSSLLQAMPDVVKFIEPLPGDFQPAVVGVFKRSVESSKQDLDGMDYAQSVIDEKHLSETETESEELLSSDAQSSSLELSSCAEKKTLDADLPSSPSDQSSSSQRKVPDVTTQAEPHPNRVEAEVTLSLDVTSAVRDQMNAPTSVLVAQTEPQVRHTEADMVAATDTSLSEAQGNLGKKGLFEWIWSLRNGPAH